jgi:hypothetical protein
MSKPPPKDDIEGAKRLMGALVRQPPKHHNEMKVGKPRPKKAMRPKKKEGK